MLKAKLFFIFSLLFSCGICAQDTSLAKKDLRPNNCIYVEGGGNAYYYSLNYARIFRDDGDHVSTSIRAGFGCIPNDSYTFPVEGSLLIGKKRNFFELGFGITFFDNLVEQYASPGGSQFYGLHDRQVWQGGVNACIRIGYCFIPAIKNNLMFRIGVTPIVFSKDFFDMYSQPNNGVKLWGGISIGYAF